jgi:hypothetical protein
MPLTSQPLAPQHASTRCLISVLVSIQIAMKRLGAGCGDVRLGCWQIAGRLLAVLDTDAVGATGHGGPAWFGQVATATPRCAG